MTPTFRSRAWKLSPPSREWPETLRTILARTGIFRAPGISEFEFPLPYRPSRVALIGGGFRLNKNMRQFAASDVASIDDWAPEVIVAPLEDMLRLAGVIKPPALSVVVVTSVNGPALSADYRSFFWKTFEAPVFEQLRGPNGAVIARECQAHDGLHLKRDMPVAFPRFELVTGECACGSAMPRLRRKRLPEKLTADEKPPE